MVRILKQSNQKCFSCLKEQKHRRKMNFLSFMLEKVHVCVQTDQMPHSCLEVLQLLQTYSCNYVMKKYQWNQLIQKRYCVKVKEFFS